MASVRKRKWTHGDTEREAWVVAYTDQGGKRRLKTFDKKKDAEGYRQKVESEISDGTHTAVSESVKVTVAAQAFYRDNDRRAKLGDITKGTALHYESDMRNGFLPAFGARNVASITAEELSAWVEKLRERYSAHSIHGHYIGVSTFLSFCVRQKWVKRNVLRDQPIKLPPKPKRTAVPSKADLAKLLNVLEKGRRLEDMNTCVVRLVSVTLGIFAGFRPGEVNGLQWESVDFERGIVHVRHSYSRTDGLKGPKSEAGYRDVPMTDPVRRALIGAAKYQHIRSLAYGPGWRSYQATAITARIYRLWKSETLEIDFAALSGYVITNRNGTPRKSEESGDGFWYRLMQDAELFDHESGRPYFTQHALRHAAVSLMIEAGLPAMNLKTFIGHKSVQTTYDIYGHLFPEDRRTLETAEAIAASLGATPARQMLITN